jgi:lipopolysaccharide transport system ATP-binding protein
VVSAIAPAQHGPLLAEGHSTSAATAQDTLSPNGCSSSAAQALGRSAITAAWVDGLGMAERPELRMPDVRIHLRAVTLGQEPPSMGFMLEQFKGVGIMSMATHAEGVQPVVIEQGQGQTTWGISLTLTDLPLHSGSYALSFYLFDAQGLVVFDEWKDHIVFDWISPSLTPGLVRLPHVWG